MAIRELLSVVMFSQLTLRGCKNLAHRNWHLNKAKISSKK